MQVCIHFCFSIDYFNYFNILVSPKHLVKLGFLDDKAINQHYEINFLMRLALQKVAFLPFSYVMDKYRFALFRNETNREHELNTAWWALRFEHGGIMAGAHRSDAVNFDPGAKYHIPSNVPYLRYFIAHILQFQFYRAMCRLQGQTKQLHLCDIYGNKDVGNKFKEMLAMGSSKPWSEVLQKLTGETKLEPQAMLDFFEPLYNWLKTENKAKGYKVGWM
jgi:peptidyl-dipeptidase A